MYGQILLGPPGSGKTTYCVGMRDFLTSLGRRVYVINMDPANENAPKAYSGASEEDAAAGKPSGVVDERRDGILWDVMEECVSLEAVMEECNLGPNGALIYSMEYIASHIDEVSSSIRTRLLEKEETASQGSSSNASHSVPPYLLFDFPGQVELFTHNTSISSIISSLSKDLHVNLCSVHLIDAMRTRSASEFISSALLTTTVMLRMELPAVNVLSKVDLLRDEEEGEFNLDFYTEVMDLVRRGGWVGAVGVGWW